MPSLLIRPAGGLPGIQGLMGSKGLKGDKGDQGKPGNPGLDGQKGDRGEQGGCKCTDGRGGNDGRPGDRGYKGDKGNTGAQGVQGLTRLKGNKGDMGLDVQNFPVPFPHILTNQLGHFIPLMGIYTAPVNGTYLFSFHIAVAGKVLKVGLFCNFYPLVRATEGDDQSTTSQTVILHLKRGDRVWLQVEDAITNITGMYTDRESTSKFSGYLLPFSSGPAHSLTESAVLQQSQNRMVEFGEPEV
uniref:C1q domain-containing protein n=1 Tax=Mola mola TaxID=94237 RepID=A0A3Q3WHI6_MOLML